MDGRTLSRTDLIISGMIVIGVLGFLSDKIVLALNNRLLRWNVQHG
jgi:NitT/TauT family transport system permease protein